MTIIKIAGSVLGMTLLVTGCTTDSGQEGDTEPTSESAPSTKATAADAAFASLGGTTVSFQEPFEHEDGLTITVGKPKAFKPTSNATTGNESSFARIAIQVDNNTTKRISLGTFLVSMASRGGAAGEIIDKKAGIVGAPRTVAPGGTVNWAQGFGLIDKTDVQVHVQAGQDRPPVVFSN